MQVILTTIGNPGTTTLSLRWADTLWLGMRGLLGRPSPGRAEGLLIKRCKRIHTVGMAYAIDVLYLDTCMRIVSVAHSVQPGRLWVPAPPCRKGVTQVIELRDCEASRLGLVPGGQLHPTQHIDPSKAMVMRERFDQVIKSAWQNESSDMHVVTTPGKTVTTVRKVTHHS